MVVTDAAGSPVQVEDLDADWLLALAEDSVTTRRIAERNQLLLAMQWCVLHEVDSRDEAAYWGQLGGRDRDIEERLGSDGTPMVAEFAVEPFAAALGISPMTGLGLLSDVLDLQHRLPRCWAMVRELKVDAWRARRVAQATRGLCAAAARHVDAQLAPILGSCGVVKIDRAVAQAAADFDPDTAADTDQAAREGYGVRLRQGEVSTGSAATSSVDITGDTPTLSRFTDLVNQLAGELAANLDDDQPLGERQITALGVLCDRAEGKTPAGENDADGEGSPAPQRRPGGGSGVKLYAHFQLTDLLDPLVSSGSRTGSVERLGPLTTEALTRWLGQTGCTITPVLDLTRTDAVDAHDPPAWMAELVRLRDRECVFPFCSRDSRACDLDHIEEYLALDRGGPRGQTHPGNLAPLCRRHHRLKTRRRWRYQRNPDGTYTWTSPHGRSYTLTLNGTIITH